MRFWTTVTTALMLVMASTSAALASVEHSLTGAGGYDLVSYHNGEKPLPGNGNHVSEVDGVVYLFANAANKKKFERNPQKYLPAYGGYCAYGVAVGKKFVGDPNVWEVVDGRLYLNLDNKIKGIWAKDVSGNIEKADETWPKIRATHASKL
ncbi:MAG: YHS domain protein [Proteobacteria bacterium]|nr:YHS domain protein [Pseudomonadota bacterium]